MKEEETKEMREIGKPTRKETDCEIEREKGKERGERKRDVYAISQGMRRQRAVTRHLGRDKYPRRHLLRNPLTNV